MDIGYGGESEYIGDEMVLLTGVDGEIEWIN